ncbi:MAG: hypothetical protein GC160_11130 [Acidobacteria bacterium]|nr:hypothetical protein [Acidobacteriota bacterium]
MTKTLLILTLMLGPLVAAAPPTDADKKAPAAQAEGETVQTPFGPVKKHAPEPRPQPTKRAAPTVDVQVANGVATFRRQTPFGVQSWKRKMTELSPAEKQLLEESQAAAAPAPAAETSVEASAPAAAPAAIEPAAKPAPKAKPMIITPRP